MQHLNLSASSSIFILSSLIGLWYSSGILPRYLATYRRQRQLLDPKVRLLAMGVHFEVLVCEILRWLVHLVFLILGAWSVFIPRGPTGLVFHQPLYITLFGHFFLWSLVGSNVALTLNTLIVRYGYRKRRGEEAPKLLTTRDTMAKMLRDIRRLQRGQRKTDERADNAQVDIDNHEGRLEVVEEVVEIKHTVKKKERE